MDDTNLFDDELTESAAHDGDNNSPAQSIFDFTQINNDEILLIDNNANMAK